MTTYVNLRQPTTHAQALTAVKDAYDLGDLNVIVSLDGVLNDGADWESSVVIYGNYGKMIVARSGEVLTYLPNEEANEDPAGGYADIVHVELDQWRQRWRLEWSEVRNSIDILMVAFHTKDGIYEPAITGCA